METRENDLLIDNIKEGYYRYYNLPSYKIIKSNFPKKEYQETFEIRQTSEDLLKKILEKRKEESGINIIFSKEAIEKLSKKPTERITTIEEEKRKQLTEEIEEIKRKWEEEKKKQIEKIISPYDIPQKKPEDLIIIEDENKEQRFTPIKYVSLPITKKKIQEESQRTPSPFERFHGGLLLQQTPQTTETPKIIEEKEYKGLIETISSIFKKKPQKEKEITETPQESPQRKSWELSGLLSSIFSKKPIEKIQENKETDQSSIKTKERSQGLIGMITSMFKKNTQKEEEPSKTTKLPETIEERKSKGFLETITSLFKKKLQEEKESPEIIKPSDKITKETKEEEVPEQTQKETIQTPEIKSEEKILPIPKPTTSLLVPKTTILPVPIDVTPTEKIITETKQKEIPKFENKKEIIKNIDEVKSPGSKSIEETSISSPTSEEKLKNIPEKEIYSQKTVATKFFTGKYPIYTPLGLGPITSLIAEKRIEYKMPDIKSKEEMQEKTQTKEEFKPTNKLQEEKIQEKTDKQVSTPSFTEEKSKQSITQDTDSKTEEKEKKEQSPVSSPEEKRNIKEQFKEQTNFNIYDLFKTTPTQKIQQETKKTDETLKHVVGYGGSLASGLVGSLLFGAWGIPISIISSAVSSVLGRAISGDKDIMKGEDLIKHIALGTGTSLVGLLIRHLMNSNKKQEIKGKIRKITTRRIRR